MRYRFSLGLVLCAVLFVAPQVLEADLMSIGSATLSVGGMANVPVNITDATDLYAFQFDLKFDPSVLQLLSITEGPFLPGAGSTAFLPGAIDNNLGAALFTADTLIGTVPGAAGSGTLVNLLFQGIGFGASSLDLQNVLLLDDTLAELPVTTESGVATIVPEVSSVLLLLTAVAACFLLRRCSHRALGE